MEAVSDEVLAQRAGSGDREAFDQLVRRHYDAIYRLAFAWRANRLDAQDIAQEVCLKLARKIDGFDGRSAFATWLYRIVINTAKDFARRAGTRHRHETAFAADRHDDEIEMPEPENSPAHRLLAALDKLPEKQKSAVLLVLGQGLSHRQAAQILGCFEATVSWRIHQARKTLARFVGV